MPVAVSYNDVVPPASANDGDIWNDPSSGDRYAWAGGQGTSGAAAGWRLTTQSRSPSNGIGYRTGAGGAVTQATDKTTGVTINNVCGAITMNNAQLNAGVEVVFTVTNSRVAARDVIIVNVATVGTSGAYLVGVGAVAAGSFDIVVSNVSGGNLSEALVLSFAVIKTVNA